MLHELCTPPHGCGLRRRNAETYIRCGFDTLSGNDSVVRQEAPQRRRTSRSSRDGGVKVGKLSIQIVSPECDYSWHEQKGDVWL